MTAQLTIKRGDDFRMDISLTDPNNNNDPVDITGWTIRSQVRRGKNLTAELTVAIIDAANGQFRLTAPASATETWKVDTHKCDIEFTQPAIGVTSSETFEVIVSEDVTYDDP